MESLRQQLLAHSHPMVAKSATIFFSDIPTSEKQEAMRVLSWHTNQEEITDLLVGVISVSEMYPDMESIHDLIQSTFSTIMFLLSVSLVDNHICV